MDWLDLRNGLARQPPFAYRLATPALAGLLEHVTGNIDSAFYIPHVFFCLVAAAFLLGLCIQVLSGSLVPGLVAIAVFMTNPAIGQVNLAGYMLTDPLALLLTAVAVYALVTRKPAVFSSLPAWSAFSTGSRYCHWSCAIR